MRRDTLDRESYLASTLRFQRGEFASRGVSLCDLLYRSKTDRPASPRGVSIWTVRGGLECFGRSERNRSELTGAEADVSIYAAFRFEASVARAMDRAFCKVRSVSRRNRCRRSRE